MKNLVLIGFTSFLLAVAVVTTSPGSQRHRSASAAVSAPFSLF